MKDEQNIFYSSISKYYSEIFPFNPVQLNYVESCIGDFQSKNILDIGCATGELSNRMAQAGAIVYGIDLNDDLLSQAKDSKQNRNLRFQHGDMLELKNDFRENEFDAILCFGNTLVHLLSKESIMQMLEGVKYILKPGGSFLLQILNYDHILQNQIDQLPLIETDNVKFVRNYKFSSGSSLIRFQTELYLKQENQVVRNDTPLLALKSGELLDLLPVAGFSDIALYANFKKEAFGGTHLPLVLKTSLM